MFPNGGDHSYFHARRSGDWARYVLDEVIPRAVARFGADPDRVAIGGISMGGFGAFDIARQRPAGSARSAATRRRSGSRAARPRRARSTTPRTSPATTSSASPGRAAASRGATLACGSTAAPPTRSGAADERLAAALHIRMRHWAGGHDGNYWQSHYKRYLRFYADALAGC